MRPALNYSRAGRSANENQTDLQSWKPMRSANLDSFNNITYEVWSIKGSETEWSQLVVICVLTWLKTSFPISDGMWVTSVEGDEVHPVVPFPIKSVKNDPDMPEVLTDSLLPSDAGEVMQITVFMSCYTRPEPSLVETTPLFHWLMSPPRGAGNLRQCSFLMEWENAALNLRK